MLKIMTILLTLAMSVCTFGANAMTISTATSPIAENEMHSVWDELLQKYVNKQGLVDYDGLKGDMRFQRYTTVLQKITPESDWTEEQHKAYWINAYNAFAIKLVIDNSPIRSIMDLDEPFDKKFIKIGSRTFSLNEIENEMLRKRYNDPRIHFGVNCASMSCPKLYNRAFTAENIEKALDKLTEEFVNNPEQNKIEKDRVEVSKIFDWYKEDFTQDGSLISFLNKYSEVEIDSNAEVSYKEYDWSLNRKK